MSEHLKVFGQWSVEGIEILDEGLKKYISLTPSVVPHSSGRHEHRRFAKSQVNIIERLANMLMRPGKNGGKKTKALSAVKNALAIIHLKTGRNPVEVFVRAVENAAPLEDVTRLSYGGIVYFKAVDISPQRRVDLALRNIAQAAMENSFKTRKTIDECLADEILLAAEKDSKSFAVKKKIELERVALASR
ncbi:MAG: 30S ribosomal protein S7 [Candidatus Caldarchaeum sp.]|nr:30S ribosomal protein S7 [Candidatus Caldarchaeum sp.]MCS7134107.1 30S ribosomal protein S7 [Candidatus Caldarchaeum sp.]MCX8201139.1 30S ribosomal protein S7 [Candidatus Caldarchaeum sp.]MDW8062971.1 30S ribosomal protein S7 [Candidatus Caldarchaeum sp.]MDW8434945.1 30S ribosomal protein S7 [Candidatus Caldarchaeum sp.]